MSGVISFGKRRCLSSNDGRIVRWPVLSTRTSTICPELAAALGADAVLVAEGYFDGIEIRRDDVLLVDGHTLSLSAVCKSGDRYFFLGHVFAVVRSLSS